MGETVLAAVAWPYANSSLHAGQIAGAYLPADIFCRYHRMRGDRTVMVSGSDVHGTPVTIRAEEEGITPEAVSERAHASFVDTFERFGIVFDLFTSTGTANHAEVTQDLFLRLHERGHIYEAEMTMLFDPGGRTPSCLTVMSRAPAPTATTRTRAATSATSAGARWTPLS